MGKELGEKELYALARGVVGERCAQVEQMLRPSDGGRLRFRTESELVFHLDLVGRASVVGIELTEREARGFLALAAMEWMFAAPDVPWIEGGTTLPESDKNNRLIASIERLHDYLDDSGSASLHSLVLRLKDETERRAAERTARAQLHSVAGFFSGIFGSGAQNVTPPQQDQPAGSQPTTTTEAAAPKDTKSDAVGVGVGVGVGYRVGRRDLLTPAIEAAQRACSDPTDAVQVWLELRAMAERRVQPLRGTTEDGIQWVDSSDAPKTLKIGALRDRIRRASTR